MKTPHDMIRNKLYVVTYDDGVTDGGPIMWYVVAKDQKAIDKVVDKVAEGHDRKHYHATDLAAFTLADFAKNYNDPALLPSKRLLVVKVRQQ